jgi:hypothetical protein
MKTATMIGLGVAAALGIYFVTRPKAGTTAAGDINPSNQKPSAQGAQQGAQPSGGSGSSGSSIPGTVTQYDQYGNQIDKALGGSGNAVGDIVNLFGG